MRIKHQAIVEFDAALFVDCRELQRALRAALRLLRREVVVSGYATAQLIYVNSVNVEGVQSR